MPFKKYLFLASILMLAIPVSTDMLNCATQTTPKAPKCVACGTQLVNGKCPNCAKCKTCGKSLKDCTCKK